MENKSAVSFPPQDKSSGFHSTLLMKKKLIKIPIKDYESLVKLSKNLNLNETILIQMAIRYYLENR
jgi:hypothetical protein